MNLPVILSGIVVLFALVILLRAAVIKAPGGLLPREKWPAYAEQSEIDRLGAAERLASLVRCRTIAPYNENGAANSDVNGFEEFIRLRSLLAEYYPLAHQALELDLVDEHTMLYRWPGKRGEEPLVLMSHYDVVPVVEKQWSHPPFGGVIADGAVWGRGALDNKATLLAIFEAVEGHLREGFIPERDIYLSFGHNEETMGSGTKSVVSLLEERGVRPGLVLDEGGAIMSGMFPGVQRPIAFVGMSEKGYANFEFSVGGSGGHASAPGKVNPFGVLASIITAVDRKPFKAHLPEEVGEMFKILGPHMPFTLRIIFVNLWCFKPLLPLLLPVIGREMNALCRTTAVFTMAEGSSAPNVIPDRASAVANVRMAKRDSLEAVRDHFTSLIKQAAAPALKGEDPYRVEVSMLYGHEASPSSRRETTAFKRLKKAIEESYPEAVTSPFIMLGGSDARHFCRISEHVYRFLPFEMSKEELRTIHGVDERIGIDRLAAAIFFYRTLITAS